MEMLIAIILLGVISSIGYNYYKNYYDTSLAAKQTKVAILIDQANQLKNMLELYKVKYGTDVTNTQGLVELVNQGFLSEIPAFIPSMAADQASGWILEDADDLGGTETPAVGTTANDLYLTYTINASISDLDTLAYCQALNNIATNGVQNFAGDVTSLEDDIDAGHLTMGNSFFCYDSGTNDSATATFVFVAKYY